MVYYLELSPGHMIAGAVIFPVIGILLSGLRFYGRQKTKLAADDWLIMPALLFLIGLCATILWGVAKKVVGYHEGNLTLADGPFVLTLYHNWGKTYWNVMWLATMMLGFTKLSLIFLYRRLFNGSRAFRLGSGVMVFLLVIWTLAFTLGTMLICGRHVSAYWTPYKQVQVKAGCMPVRKFFLAWTWSDVGTDLILILMPIPSVLRLQMSLRRKLSVIAIFLLGTLSLLASTLRAVQMIYLLAIKQSRVFDRFMLYTNFEYWILLETGLAFIAVNLPVLYGLARRESLDRSLRTFRSFMSLHSSRSEASDEPAEADPEAKLPIVQTSSVHGTWYRA